MTLLVLIMYLKYAVDDLGVSAEAIGTVFLVAKLKMRGALPRCRVRWSGATVHAADGAAQPHDRTQPAVSVISHRRSDTKPAFDFDGPELFFD